MRRAGSESGWHLTKTGDTLGFSLHGDTCTEHEVGVGPLKSALGVPDHFENGLTDRVNTRLPPAFRFETYTTADGKPAAKLLVGSPRYHRVMAEDVDFIGYMSKELDFRPPYISRLDDPKVASARADFSAAWDEDGCIVHVRGLGNVHRLQSMARSFEANDVAFGSKLVGKNPAQRIGGLTFVRASKVDPDLLAETLREDQAEVRLRAAADLVLPQLKADLRAAGKNWFAISPRWKNRDQESEGLMFWLNPYEQRDHNSGSYTEDELRAWGNNAGPVMKDKPLEEEARRNRDAMEKLRKAMDRAHIASPWTSTVRSSADKNKFSIRVSYGDGDIDKGWTKLEEGEFTLAQIRDCIPPIPPRVRRRTP